MSYQREFPRRLDVAVVGAGSHTYRNLLPAMNFLPVRVRAICDVNEPLARATAEQYGAVAHVRSSEMYRSMKLDAVFLSVSPAHHPQLAIEAFEAGLNVWMEKPPAIRAAEVGKMIDHRGDRVAVVGLKKAFMPSTQKVIEILGKPSEVQSLTAEYPMTIADDGEKLLAERRVTNWLSNGVHPLSLLMAVAGPVDGVTVVKGRNGSAACLLDFAGGALGNFHMAYGGPSYFTHERYTFYGRKCQMEIDNGSKVTMRRGIPFDYAHTTSFAPPGLESGSVVWEPQNFLATLENMSLFTQGFYFSMRHFCDSILETKPATQGTLENALDLMRVYEAALLSHGNRVPVSQIS